MFLVLVPEYLLIVVVVAAVVVVVVVIIGGRTVRLKSGGRTVYENIKIQIMFKWNDFIYVCL